MHSLLSLPEDEEVLLLRLAAYNILTKYETDSLPIDPLSQLQLDDKVKIYSQQFLAEYWGDDIGYYLKEYEHGFLTYSADMDKHIVFYNEEDPPEVKRWMLAVAISEIFLSTKVDEMAIALSDRYTYAEEFSYFYLAPDIILDRCKISTMEEILEYCKIPFNKAHYKAKKLRKQRNSKDVKRDFLEDSLLKNFSRFINKANKRPSLRQQERPSNTTRSSAPM